jgi:hypothetical protein
MNADQEKAFQEKIHTPRPVPEKFRIPGFDKLSVGGGKSILKEAVRAGFDVADRKEPHEIDELSKDDIETHLTTLSVDQLMKLLTSEEHFKYGSDITMVIPDHGEGIRSSLWSRIWELQESARHAGTVIPGADDLENNLLNIQESQHSPAKSPEDKYPF